MKRAAAVFLALTLTGGVAAPVFAAEEKPKMETAKVSGKISAVSSSGIAVQFESSAKNGGREIYLPLTAQTKFEKVASAAQLKYGDTVQVVYEQKYREPEKGKKVLMGATATQVVLLKQAPAEGTLVSGGEEAR